MEDKVPDNALAQYDLGNVKTQIGFFKTIFRLHDLTMEHCVPARVLKYDRENHKATVRPIVCNVSDTPNGEVAFRRPEYEVCVLNFCHGGYIFDAPIFAGDTGWLISCDRNTTTAISKNSTRLYENEKDPDKNENAEQPPDDSSIGGFEFGFFIPCGFAAGEKVAEDGAVFKFDSPGSPNGYPSGSFKITLNKDYIVLHRDSSIDKSVDIVIDDSRVSLTRTGEKTDRISITDAGFEIESEYDGQQEVVVDMRYDMASHSIQKKTVTFYFRGNLIVGKSEESDWTTINGGQAVQMPEDE